jgi:membrane-associated phospholipid phosphatase
MTKVETGVIAGYLSVLALMSVFDNYGSFLWLNNAGGGILWDYLWGTITQLGDGLFAILLAIMLLRIRPDYTGKMLIALFATLFIVAFLKSFFGVPRPPSVFAPDTINIIGPVLKNKSFPSGHTTTATMTGILLLFRGSDLSRGYRSAILGLTILAGISRIFVGAHFPLDVFAGHMLGLAIAYGALVVFENWKGLGTFLRKRTVMIVLSFLGVGTVVFIYTGFKPYLHHPEVYIGLSVIALLVIGRNIVLLIRNS